VPAAGVGGLYRRAPAHAPMGFLMLALALVAVVLFFVFKKKAPRE
jgi:hypothetical protein